MKSLLVDVLRQAQDDARPDDSEPARSPRTEPGPGDDAPLPSPEDLNLLETGQFPAESGAVDESIGIDDVAAPAVENPEPESVADPAPLAATSILKSRGARLSGGLPRVIRIGRLAPIICLFAIAAVISGYLLLNKVTGGSLNEDLEEISGIVREDSRRNWLDEAVADTDVFDRLVPAMPPDDTPTPDSEPRGAAERVADTAGATSAPGREVPATDRSATIDATRGQAATVDDLAYRHVADAYAAYQAGDYDEAERQYDLALAIEPHHRNALLGIAVVLQQTGRQADAVAAYERVLRIEPGNTVAASAILSIRSAEAGWDSESELKHLLQRFPDADHLHFALGSIYVGEARWAEARQAFAAAYRLAPANPAYSYNLAVSCEHLSDLRCARTNYRTALEHADAHSTVDRNAVESHLDRLSAHVPEGS